MAGLIEYVTPREHAELQADVQALTALVVRLVITDDTMVPTVEALRLTGIKSDTTLRSEYARAGSVLTRKKVGRSVMWSRNSCLMYAHQRRGFVLPSAVQDALRPPTKTNA